MSDRDALCQAGVSEITIPSNSLSTDGVSLNFASDTLPESSTSPRSALSSKHYLATKNVSPDSSSPQLPLARSPDPMQTENMLSPSSQRESDAALALILLLTSGQRFPYKIDEKFLETRNIKMPEVMEDGRKDPFSISIYTLKELILREWREEWGIRPSSPSSIRLIFFGRLLEDNKSLLNCRFNDKTSNVVHMTVRPHDIMDEEDASKSKIISRDRENSEPTTGCRCILM